MVEKRDVWMSFARAVLEMHGFPMVRTTSARQELQVGLWRAPIHRRK